MLGAEGDAGVVDGPGVLQPLLERGHPCVELVHRDAGLPGEQTHDSAGLKEPQYQVGNLVFLSHAENVQYSRDSLDIKKTAYIFYFETRKMFLHPQWLTPK